MLVSEAPSTYLCITKANHFLIYVLKMEPLALFKDWSDLFIQIICLNYGNIFFLLLVFANNPRLYPQCLPVLFFLNFILNLFFN